VATVRQLRDLTACFGTEADTATLVLGTIVSNRPRLCKNADEARMRTKSAFQNARYGVFKGAGMASRPPKMFQLRVFTQPGPTADFRKNIQ
jgi:hypothetical protein